MSEIFDVQYPAPVRHVPKGGRQEKVSYIRDSVPVRLNHVDAGEVEPVARYHAPDPAEFYAHAGKVWLKLDRYVDGWNIAEGYGVEQFRRFLAGEDQGQVSDVFRSFVQTPVGAVDPATGQATRGEDIDLASSRKLVSDGRDMARGDLVRFLEESVLVADGKVYVRNGGPLAAREGASYEMPYRVVTHPRFESSRWRFPTYPCRMDMVEDQEAYDRIRRGVPYRGLGDWTGGGIGSALLDDADIVLLANDLPGLVLRAMKAHVKAGERSGPLLELARALDPWMVLGQSGRIRREYVEEPLRLSRDLATRVCGHMFDSSALMGLRDYVDGFVLPRLTAPEPIEDVDLHALGGLAGPGA